MTSARKNPGLLVRASSLGRASGSEQRGDQLSSRGATLFYVGDSCFQPLNGARSHPVSGARSHPVGLRGLIVLGMGLLAGGLAACGGEGPESFPVAPPQPTGPSALECAYLLDGLPDLVLEQEPRGVQPADASAAAWGDPAVVLRCGVERPAGLKPSSPCFVANDVGWFADESNDSEVVFTTIGRSTYVEVTVPAEYPQPSGALAELSAAVMGSTTEVLPCV